MRRLGSVEVYCIAEGNPPTYKVVINAGKTTLTEEGFRSLSAALGAAADELVKRERIR